MIAIGIFLTIIFTISIIIYYVDEVNNKNLPIFFIIALLISVFLIGLDPYLTHRDSEWVMQQEYRTDTIKDIKFPFVMTVQEWEYTDGREFTLTRDRSEIKIISVER